MGVSMWESAYIQERRKFHLFAHTHDCAIPFMRTASRVAGSSVTS